MNKYWPVFVLGSTMLLVGCHSNRQNSPSQNPVPTPIITPEQQPKYSLILSSRPIADFSIFEDKPFSQAAPKSGPVGITGQSVGNTEPAPIIFEEITPEETPTPIAATPVAPSVYPPDTAIFKSEDLISTADRMLSDYAYAPIDPALTAQYNAPWKGEQLKFGVYYGFIKAGNAYIKNRGIVVVNKRPAYLLQTTAFSATVIDAVFKVRDINLSWIDAETFASLGYTQSIREGKYVRDEWVHFDYNTMKFYGKVQRKGPPFPIGGDISGKVSDILSSLYYIRGQKLEIGKDVIIDVVNREKAYPFTVKVIKKEKIKTSAGTFNTVKVEPQLRGEGIFIQKGKSLQVWLTDDEYHMPVKMKTEVFIGSVSAELLEYKRY